MRNVLILAAMMLLTVAVYATFNPEQGFWAPPCVFRLLTGFSCPACGVQRAAHAFLHGHWREALLYNPFLIVSVPYVAALLLESCVLKGRARARVAAVAYHPVTVRMFIVLLVLWGIVRNVCGL